MSFSNNRENSSRSHSPAIEELQGQIREVLILIGLSENVIRFVDHAVKKSFELGREEMILKNLSQEVSSKEETFLHTKF